MTAFQMLDEVAAVTAERDRARDLAAKLEQRLELAERVVEGYRAFDRMRPEDYLSGAAFFADRHRLRQSARDALAEYEASR